MDEEAFRARIAAEVPPGMLAHTDRVAAIATALAERHRLDSGLVRLMALGHDVLRAVPPAELLHRAEACGLPVDPVERAVPVILHGPLGALALAERFDVRDPRILFAVQWHTTGHPDYDAEAWAMFIADKVDPHKVERWPALADVREIAERSLEAAALRYLDLRLEEALARRLLVHPMATRTRNALIERVVGPPSAD
ncbi:MAG: bis(5'-nucleosyl)-tetraphosphatase (symmetrical) YqeK [Dehalococcoidia bacterium]